MTFDIFNDCNHACLASLIAEEPRFTTPSTIHLRMVSIKSGSAATAAALTLFGAPGSSTTNRLRIALAVKGAPYAFEKIDMVLTNHVLKRIAKP